LKLEGVENALDIRVESLVASIHDCRDKCREKLVEFKQKFLQLTYLLFLNLIHIFIYSCCRNCENNFNFEKFNQKFNLFNNLYYLSLICSIFSITVEVLKVNQKKLRDYEAVWNRLKESLDEVLD
jgi:hypothetical protein